MVEVIKNEDIKCREQEQLEKYLLKRYGEILTYSNDYKNKGLSTLDFIYEYNNGNKVGIEITEVFSDDKYKGGEINKIKKAILNFLEELRNSYKKEYPNLQLKIFFRDNKKPLPKKSSEKYENLKKEVLEQVTQAFDTLDNIRLLDFKENDMPIGEYIKQILVEYSEIPFHKLPMHSVKNVGGLLQMWGKIEKFKSDEELGINTDKRELLLVSDNCEFGQIDISEFGQEILKLEKEEGKKLSFDEIIWLCPYKEMQIWNKENNEVECFS